MKCSVLLKERPVRIIISPAKRLNADTDSFAPDALPKFLLETEQISQRCRVSALLFRRTQSARNITGNTWFFGSLNCLRKPPFHLDIVLMLGV